MRRLSEFVRSNWKWLTPASIAVVGGLAWVAFGYFGVHTLWIDDEVSEADPFAVEASVDPAAQPAAATDEATVTPTEATTDRPAPDTAATAEPTAEATQEPAEVPTPAGPVTSHVGEFFSLDHGTSGQALIRTDGIQTFLRFENFATDNGPDLNVYLVKGDAGTGGVGEDWIDLGDLKGNIGEQNYELPAGVDLSEYTGVVIWCVRFSVAFGGANLAAA